MQQSYDTNVLNLSDVFVNIPEYDGYQINNGGQIKSLKGTKERILKTSLRGCGYSKVELSQNGIRKSITVHKLMERCFFLESKPQETGDWTLDHIDRNKLNNHITNLRWTTISQQKMNQDKRKGSTSKYHGVSKYLNSWAVRVKVNYKQVHLGYFYFNETNKDENEKQAAKCYNAYVINNKLENRLNDITD